MWKRFEWTGKAKKRNENDELDPKSWTPFLLRNVFLSTFLKKTKSCLIIVHVCTVHLHRQWKQGWLKRGWHSSRPSFVWFVVVRAVHWRHPNLLSSLSDAHPQQKSAQVSPAVVAPGYPVRGDNATTSLTLPSLPSRGSLSRDALVKITFRWS